MTSFPYHHDCSLYPSITWLQLKRGKKSFNTNAESLLIIWKGAIGHVSWLKFNEILIFVKLFRWKINVLICQLVHYFPSQWQLDRKPFSFLKRKWITTKFGIDRSAFNFDIHVGLYLNKSIAERCIVRMSFALPSFSILSFTSVHVMLRTNIK